MIAPLVAPPGNAVNFISAVLDDICGTELVPVLFCVPPPGGGGTEGLSLPLLWELATLLLPDAWLLPAEVVS